MSRAGNRPESASLTGISHAGLSVPEPAAAGSITPPRIDAGGFAGGLEVALPLALPKARGLAPDISLVYSARAGNGPFGLGFAVNLPGFVLRLSLGVPQYQGADPVDFSPAGPLTPRVGAGLGNPQGRVYVPVVETEFDLLVRQDNADGTCYWQQTDRENRTSLFGSSERSRVFDPEAPQRIAEWLIDETTDAQGNRIRYQYKADNDANAPDAVYAVNRGPPAQRYLERIGWGNYWTDDPAPVGRDAYELVFDYGEYELGDLDRPGSDPYRPVRTWPARADAWSSYRAGFELRSQRLCRNILLFHRFAELGEQPCLVRAWCLEQLEDSVFTTVRSVTEVGFRRRGDGSYERASLPPLSFDYARFEPPVAPVYSPLELDTIGPEFPGLLHAPTLEPIDLDGEGLPGLLSSEGPALLYRAPLGGGRYQAPQTLLEFPDAGLPEPPQRTLADLAGDGHYYLVVNGESGQGYYARSEGRWRPYTSFAAYPTLRPGIASTQASLSGTGRDDALVFEGENLWLYPGLGTAGYGAARLSPLPHDFPIATSGSELEVLSFVDPFGDGLAHRVRVRDGSFEVWPSLGHGRFGARIVLEGSPRFAAGIDANRIFLSPISGGAGVDVIVVHDDYLAIHVNQSGNGFAEPVRVNLPGQLSDPQQLAFVDLMGLATAGIAFTHTHPQVAHLVYPLRGQAPQGSTRPALRPWLLTHLDNHQGNRTEFVYASSTQYAVAARQRGEPWVTHLPFAVEVLAEVIQTDVFNAIQTRQRFDYADGFYDTWLREFRGFGRVDEREQEIPLAQDGVAVPVSAAPQLTRTWYLVGDDRHDAGLCAQYRAQYFAGDTEAIVLAQTCFDAHIAAAGPETVDQAWRALAGRQVRQERYGDEGGLASSQPYTVSDTCWALRLEQPAEGSRLASVLVHEREAVHYDYDRVAADPSIQHTFVLKVDSYGSIERGCTVFYPRRSVGTDIASCPEQFALRGTVAMTSVSAVVEPFRLLGTPFSSKELTLGGLDLLGKSHFSWPQIEAQVASALAATIAYGAAFTPGQLQSRPYQWQRSLYWDEAQQAALPLGQISARALLHHEEWAVWSDAWLEQTFADKVDVEYLINQGGYGVDDESYWWNRGVVTDYGLPDAPERFFMPWRSRFEPAPDSKPVDGLLQASELEYDRPYHLFPQSSRQRINEDLWQRNELQTNYQTLTPSVSVDINGNYHQCVYDALGRLLATSIFKPAGPSWPREGDGDLFDSLDFERRPDATFADVLARKAHYVQQATSFHFYDSLAFLRDASPCVRVSLVRQTHVSALAPETSTLILAESAFMDGLGRPLQARRETPPSPGETAPGWLVGRCSVYNMQGQVAAQHLPWYAATAQYQSPEFAPVPPRRYQYDAVERILRVDDPKGFFSRNHYSPWCDERFDRDDTVLDAPYYLWFMANYPAQPTIAQEDEKAALEQAARYYNTPSLEIFDNAGHPIRTVANNLGNVSVEALEDIVDGSAVTAQQLWDDLHRCGYLHTSNAPPVGTWVTEKFQPYSAGFVMQLGPDFEQFSAATTQVLRANGLTTYLANDLQGRQEAVIDPRLYYANLTQGSDHVNFRYAYPMQQGQQSQRPMRAISADAGTAWTLPNIYGSSIRTWDSRSQGESKRYDRLQRLLESEVETVGATRLSQVQTWGDSIADAARWNLCGQIYECRDQAGLLRNAAYDLQEQCVQRTRTLTLDYRLAPNWRHAVDLQEVSYPCATRYDVQSQVTEQTFVDNRGYTLVYDVSGRLTRAALREGTAADAPVVERIDWNAASFVEQVVFRGGVTQQRFFEDTTQRILQLRASSGAQALQAVDYSYDPMGHVMMLRDRTASLLFCYPQPEFKSGRRYDALYQLIEASGHEHPGIGPQTHVDGFKQSIFSALCPTNPAEQVTLRAFVEQYSYDDARNQIRLRHGLPGGGLDYERLQPVRDDSNRLAQSSYDASGNPEQLELAGPVALHWDERNLLAHTGQFSRSAPSAQQEWYVYDHNGQRVRKVIEHLDAAGELTAVDDRVYVGNFQSNWRDVGAKGSATWVSNRIRLADAGTLLAILDQSTSGAPEVRLQLGDQQASISIETAPDGTPLSFESYYPFGGTAVVAGPDQATVEPKHYRYSGKIADDGLGLYDYGARYLAPWTGRWLNPDPSGPIDGPNLFQFVLDDPTTLVDGDGRVAIVRRRPGRNGQLPTVSIHIEGVLVNNSGILYTPLQMRRFARRLERQIARSYRGQGPNVRFVGSARIRASQRIERNDHVFRLVPVGRLPTYQEGVGPRYLPGHYRGGGVVGYAPGRNLVGGLRERQRAVFVRHNIANQVPATVGIHAGTGRTLGGGASFERTGAHELGHTLGLNHPGGGGLPGNLMNQTGNPNAGMQITEAQALTVEAEFNGGRLNGQDQGVDTSLFPF